MTWTFVTQDETARRLAVAARQQWAVWINFDWRLYKSIQRAPSGQHLPSEPLQYLRREVKDEEVVNHVWPNDALFHFPDEQTARKFFKVVPEGSLVHAELYSPDGESYTDNT